MRFSKAQHFLWSFIRLITFAQAKNPHSGDGSKSKLMEFADFRPEKNQYRSACPQETLSPHA